MSVPRSLCRVPLGLVRVSRIQVRGLTLAATIRNAENVSPRLRMAAPSAAARALSTSVARARGIMPDTDNPAKEAEPSPITTSRPELSDSEYHQLADECLEKLLCKFEEVQDERADVEVEYASGVLNLSFGEKGKYVINKQPPNKQIWLSSPVSGPARYDWVLYGESQSDKEGTAIGTWVNTRTGTPLDELFQDELGLDTTIPAFE